MTTLWGCPWFPCFLLYAILVPSSSWISTSSLPVRQRVRRYCSAVSKCDDESLLDLDLLLLDHYDSYTYNLYDQIAQLCQKPPLVLPKDVASSWSELQVFLREAHNIRKLDGVILSPGPGRPTMSDLGADIIRCNPTLPILGVCLGHQMLATTYYESDGAVICAPHGPVHGHVHSIHHNGRCPLFRGISCPFPATRYHSLVVQMPPSSRHDQTKQIDVLETTAVCYDPSNQTPIIMGLAHSSNPHYGVQFHPESIGTQPHGHLITQNFLRICQEFQQRQRQHQSHFLPLQESRLASRTFEPLARSLSYSTTSARQQQQVFIYKVPTLARPLSPEEVFDSLMANQPYSVWLDGTNHHQPTQCSILTCYNHEKDDGGYRVEYYGKEHEDHVRGLYVYRPQSDGDRNGETIVKGDHNRKRELCKRYNRDILSFLQREHSHATNHVNLVACLAGVNGASAAEPVIQRLTDVDAKELLPFDFRGGHVGYLGYEVRHDIESRLRTPMNDDNSGSNHDDIHNSNHNPRFHSKINNKLSSAFLDKETTAVPTAAFLFAHQSLVYDPNEKEWYMVGVLDPTRSTKDSIFQWFKNTEIELQHLATTQIDETSDIQPLLKISLPTPTIVSRAPLFETLRCKAAYQRNIAECREFIRLGESYELCLTNQFVTTVQDRDEQRTSWDLYQILRRRNPAPFSAYLNWNSLQVPQENRVGLNGDKRESARVAICCSSPERFVSVQRQAHDEKSCVNNPTFIVEAKPIKGTCARVQPTNGDTQLTTSQLREDIQRAEDLQASIKNRAENLMIVDLLRNDLSRVCRIGSVHVPKLMHTESYTTVHQLVSTIRGALDEGKTAVDVLETCFPGGSMTGAPKLRTLELLDQLEEGLSRGPYSGCLGYISLNGSMDMNIIIRSAVVTPSADNKAWNVSIGAGGAITALSDVDDEYDEMVLKAKVVMEAVQKWADHHCCRQRVASSGAATLTERSEFLTRG